MDHLFADYFPRFRPLIDTKASITIALLISFSFSGGRDGSPTGWVMARPGTTRFMPNCSAISLNVVIRAVGIPAFSISLLITAPQRVPVPHVDVKMAADTPCFFKSCAMLSPIFLAVSTGIDSPVVV